MSGIPEWIAQRAWADAKARKTVNANIAAAATVRRQLGRPPNDAPKRSTQVNEEQPMTRRDHPDAAELLRAVTQARSEGRKTPFVRPVYNQPDPPEGGTTEISLDDLLRAAVNRKDKS